MNNMMPHLLAFQFDGQEVEFDIAGEEVMINATEMAHIFAKEPYEFLRLEQTKRFIAAMESAIPAFRTGTAPVLNAGIALVESENDPQNDEPVPELVRTEKGKGVDGGVTWMHRVLALKFAAWLSAEFEVWIYRTIEQVLHAHGQRIGQEVREKARLLDRREEIKAQLQAEPLFQEYLLLDFKIRQASNRMAKHTTNQLSIFRQSA
ncbi:MAG: KilA-N domain-containing protein [Janthinobacterium lividum]